jgi:hypothetical protein
MIDFLKNSAGVVVQLLALFGRRDASGVAHQKFDAEFFLKTFDLLTDRWLRDAKHLGCAREIAALGNLNEILELTQVHPTLSNATFVLSADGSVNVLSKCAFAKTVAYGYV